MKTHRRHLLAPTAAALLPILTAPGLFAQTTSTSAADGNWSDPATWDTVNFPDNQNPGAPYTAVLDGETVTLDIAGLDVNGLTLSAGILTGGFGLAVSQSLTWTGGTMSGAGTTSVAGLASTIDNTAGTVFLGRVLANTGTIAFNSTDANSVFFGPDVLTPGVLNNAGTFNVTAGGDFSAFFVNASHAINNSGAWNVSGAATTSSVGSGIAFNNTGTVSVTSGTLALGGGGTNTGSFSVNPGATLNFIGGTHDLNAGTSVIGAGTVELGGATWNFNAGTYNVTGTTLITSGTADFNAPATTNLLTLSGGTLGGSAAVSATGNLTWTGGTMSGAGTTSVAGPASTIDDTAGLVILGRVLANTGAIAFNSADANNGIFGPDVLTPGVLNNAGTFNVTAGGDFTAFFVNASHAINNSGTWNVSGAGTTSSVGNGIAFNNTGTVDVQSGIL